MIEVPEFQDRELVCLDCGQKFIFTESEQRFFWSKNLSEPKRCKPCRMFRRRSIMNVKEKSECLFTTEVQLRH